MPFVDQILRCLQLVRIGLKMKSQSNDAHSMYINQNILSHYNFFLKKTSGFEPQITTCCFTINKKMITIQSNFRAYFYHL